MIYRFDRFELDATEFRLRRSGEDVLLEPKALRLLLHLVERPGHLVRKQELLDAVWTDTAVGENALTRSVTLVRKALDDSSREPRFLETVPTVGYRFLAEVMTGAAQRAAEVVVSPGVLVQPEVRRRSGVGRGVVRWVGIVAVGAVVLAVGWRTAAARRARPALESIAVLPFENLSGDAGQEYFADGTTDELITELAQIPSLRVVSRTSVMGEKGGRKALRQIGAELGVDAVVEGSVARSGDRVRINAQLVEVEGDRHLWASSFEGSAGDMVGLEDRIAGEIASHARLAAVPGGGSMRVSRVTSPEAHDAYLRGLYFYDRREIVKSAASFQQAIDLDPAYSSAYAGYAVALDSVGLAAAAVPEGLIARARAAAQKAIDLDPQNGEAYLALGTVETTIGWDWEVAEKNLKKGLELSPHNSVGRMWHAIFRDVMGHLDEGVREMRRAMDDDPLSFFLTRQYADTLYYARRYDEALVQLERAREMHPDRPTLTEHWMSWAYEGKGMFDEAVRHDLLNGGDMTQVDQAGLRLANQRGGWKGYWQERLVQSKPESWTGCTYYYGAMAYLRVGDRDRAFAAMNRAVDEHCFWMTELLVDPKLDGVRGDARYGGLVGRMGLAGR